LVLVDQIVSYVLSCSIPKHSLPWVDRDLEVQLVMVLALAVLVLVLLMAGLFSLVWYAFQDTGPCL
jgi:hypothetical protein